MLEPRPWIVPLEGEWEFTYTPHLRGGRHAPPLDLRADPPLPGWEANHAGLTPALDWEWGPGRQAHFEALMPVPGMWDDHLERLRPTACWEEARFNPEYRPLEFPVGSRWCPDGSLPFLLGVGWYRRQVHLPAEGAGGLATLQVGGVRLEAWVWLNGRFVGHHLGPSTGFELPLTAVARWGESNELILAVANTRTDRGGCALRCFQGRSAGLYGPVRLKLTGPARIADCYLRPQGEAGLAWRVELAGDPAGAELAWTVRDPRSGEPQGQGLVPVNGPVVEWETDRLGLAPWSDHDPRLYRVELALRAGGELLDRHGQSFGLRRLQAEGTRLRLNGRPVLLRGVTDHYYYPLTCTAPPDAESHRQMLRRLQGIGFNWVRFHTWVPPEPYLQAADELGMLLAVEAPVGYRGEEWRAILRACRRHPSVVIYSCGNEGLLDDEKLEELAERAAECRELAPDALFSPQEALRGIEYAWSPTDLGEDAVPEPYPHNSRRLARVKQYSDVLASYAWGQLSYGSLQADPPELERRWAAYERPILAHELGIQGNYLNLDLEHRYRGTRIGPELFAAARRQLRRAGREAHAAVYYRHSCAWMRALRKHNLEAARKCPSVAGYDFLGATDHHGHTTGYPGGILNEFYELKPGESEAEVLRYNGESVLLLDPDGDRNLVAGQECGFELRVSWYGAEPLRGARVSWALRAGPGRVAARGGWACPELGPGAIHPLGEVCFTVPQLDQPQQFTLAVRLEGEGGEVENAWDLWGFPPPNWARRADRPPVELVSALDPAVVERLAAGARVGLLGTAPLPAQATGFQMSCAGRPQGNLATVIADHPLLAEFPHQGYCDWQCRRLLEGGAAVVFSDLPLPFDPIVEVVSSFKQVVLQAAVFELQVGAGKLLVCGLNLAGEDPAQAWLRARLEAYLAGEQFRPRCAAEPAELLAALAAGATRPLPVAATLMGYDPNAQLP